VRLLTTAASAVYLLCFPATAQALPAEAAPVSGDSEAVASTPDASPAIVITASRSGEALETIPVAATVVDETELGQQLQQSGDILRTLDFTVPGLNLSADGRSQCLTRVRGRVPAFQLNGVPANQDLRPSNCNSAFQISPFAIERIEVVRGATALFGAGAPGGVINLITRRATSDQLEVDGVVQTGFDTGKPAGTFQTDLYAGLGRRVGAFDFYVGGGLQDYGVGRDPNGERIVGTAFEAMSLNGSAGLALSPSVRLRLTGTHFRERPGTEYNVDGAEVSAGVAFPRVVRVTDNPFRDESRDRLTTLALSIEADRVLGHKLLGFAFGQWQEFRQRANFQDFNDGNADFFSDDRTNSTIGTRLTLARKFALGTSELGLEYGVDWRRDRLIRLLLDPEDTDIVTGFIAPEVILYQTGLFAQANLDLGRARLIGGARQEFYRGRIGDKLAERGLPGTGAPGKFAKADLALFNAGAVFDVTRAIQLYASYTEGAELTQLGRAARRATDPGLISPEPAKSHQIEIGARGRLGRVEGSLAAFRSRSDAASLVQPDPSCAGQSFCPLIPLRVPQKVWGVEASADWRISPRVDLGALFTWQRGEIFDQTLDRYIPFGTDIVSPTRFAVRGGWRATPRLRLHAQASYSAKASFFSVAEQEIGLINTPSLFIADASLAYRVGPGEITAAVTNLFDNEYQNITLAAGGFTPSLASGRRLTIGYHLKLGR
jgi:iron complex outermembrane receptor protein